MNIPVDIARQAIDGLKSTPALLMVILLNIVMLTGFAWTLSKVAGTIERRDAILAQCIQR